LFEGEMHTVNKDPFVHTAADTIEKMDLAHMVEHAKLVIGFMLELAFVKL
jgi:leucyl aminopeptidase